MLSLEEPTQNLLYTDLEGVALLENPMLNKGTAFTQEERDTFGLDGLLPPYVTDLDEQAERAWEELSFKASDMEKHIYLRSLQDRNEVLFYRVLLDHLEETMPLIYTPVVGWACRHFSHIYRRPRGLFIAYPHRNRIDEILENRPYRDVDVIVVTDGERILGLGDQGVGGMGIPIGKLSLYSLCGGIHPARTLPILLDCGTDNEERLSDPHYLGWRHPRVRGSEYDDFIEQFVQSVQRRLPGVLLQWEDFSKCHASNLLDRYRDRLCTFNDDIQGTAAVTVAAVMSALRRAGGDLAELRVVISGAGSAAVGIAGLLADAMIDAGVSETQALSRFWLLNSKGLLVEGMQGLQPFQSRFVKSKTDLKSWPAPRQEHYQLDEVVKAVGPNVLIGVSGQPSIFTETIVRSIASITRAPIILPLSNPTSQAEATPDDIAIWTDNRAIVATGSPFPGVPQCNNSYIFPGLGLGVIAAGARRVTSSMFMAAAQELARCALDMEGSVAILPPISRIREVSRRIAGAVALEACRSGLAGIDEEKVASSVRAQMWSPAYPSFCRAPIPGNCERVHDQHARDADVVWT